MARQREDGSVERWLAEYVIENDKSRCALRKAAIDAQVVAGRFALMEGMRQKLPGTALVFLAHCIDLFNQGGVVDFGKRINSVKGESWRRKLGDFGNSPQKTINRLAEVTNSFK